MIFENPGLFDNEIRNLSFIIIIDFGFENLDF